MSETIFRIGGWLLVVSGAIGLFFWIVSLLEGWATPSPIPSAGDLGALGGMELLKGIFIVIGSLVVSLGLVLCGLLFIKLPKLAATGNTEVDSLEHKMNKLQIIVWKVLQKVKERKETA